jgi:hypothetical protein
MGNTSPLRQAVAEVSSSFAPGQGLSKSQIAQLDNFSKRPITWATKMVNQPTAGQTPPGTDLNETGLSVR